MHPPSIGPESRIASLRRAAGRRWARARRRLAIALRPLRRALNRLRDPASPAREIHLAWCDDPSRTLSVCWAGDSRRNPGRVEVRPAEGGPWRSVQGESRARPGGSGMLHVAHVHGLEPGGSYDYRVSCDAGHEADWSDVHPARTAPSASASGGGRFEAVFLSDVGLAGRGDGLADAATAVIDAIARSAPLVVLGGGDYAYADRDGRFADPADAVSAWFDQMQPLLARAPFVASLGNHEMHLGELGDDWASRLPRPPGEPGIRSFSIDVGPVHLVSLHAPGLAPSPRELAWLRKDLASDHARSAPWRIVFQHAPLFAHGACHPARPEVRRLASLFDELRVDLHLSGHDQSYERTHVLRGAGEIVLPDLADPVVSYAAGRGVIYAKVSPAGKRSDRGLGFSRFAEPPPPEVAARSDTGHHWARIEGDANALELWVERLSDPVGDLDVVDRLRLVRRGAGASGPP